VDSTVEEETSLLVGDMDIDALNDEELFKLLQENGISVGPIVGSTRWVPCFKVMIVVDSLKIRNYYLESGV
jgi:hypothetical protein